MSSASATHHPTIKVISRDSALAIKQVEEVFSQLENINYELVAIKSLGDKNKQICLMDSPAKDIFTRELDEAILKQQADIAIHSAKDLPFPLPDGLEVISLLASADKSDSLVSKDDVALKQLPVGARVGTSSPARRKQLLDIRPDIKIVSIRGTIEERVAQIDKGIIDALIVATCALERLGLEDKITERLPFETHPLQGNLAIVAHKNYQSSSLFSHLDIRKTYGKVFLLGAGVGNKDLLTIKADKILREVDQIFYDDLLDKNMLDDYPGEKIYVGKRKGQHHVKQEETNQLLFEAASKGKNIARLKCGDPFIYGRGGEEIHFLQQRCINTEVVPGISAAQAAAANSQIPLTLRNVSSNLIFRTGHKASTPPQDEIKNDKQTVVYYMGATNLSEIKQELLLEDRNSTTPVALIQDANSAEQKKIITTIGEMDRCDCKSPLIIIVGDVVAEQNPRPRVLYTGINPYNSKVTGEIFQYPLIKTEPCHCSIDPSQFDGFIFTSKNSVRHFLSKYQLNSNQKIFAIGNVTKKELVNYGIKTDYMPEVADSDHMVELINQLDFNNLGYPCSDKSHNGLHQLKNVTPITCYNTLAIQQDKIDLNNFDKIVFSSGSTVEAFFKIYDEIPKQIRIHVYGKHSLKALKNKGVTNDIQTI